MREFKLEDLDHWEIDGVDPKDFPDFCDAFLSFAIAFNRFGGPYELTEEECDYIQATYPEWINEQAFESLIP